MFWCSKEPSHRDGSFEYPQHMFGFRNKKINFSYTLFFGGLPRVFIVHIKGRVKGSHVSVSKLRCTSYPEDCFYNGGARRLKKFGTPTGNYWI